MNANQKINLFRSFIQLEFNIETFDRKIKKIEI